MASVMREVGPTKGITSFGSSLPMDLIVIYMGDGIVHPCAFSGALALTCESVCPGQNDGMLSSVGLSLIVFAVPIRFSSESDRIAANDIVQDQIHEDEFSMSDICPLNIVVFMHPAVGSRMCQQSKTYSTTKPHNKLQCCPIVSHTHLNTICETAIRRGCTKNLLTY